MPYHLVYADGVRQALPGRIGITKQDNDLTKLESIQAASTSTLALPDSVAQHARLGLPQVGTSRSDTPYQGQLVTLEAGGVEVLPNARLALDDYTPRSGYTGRLLGGNRAFYDLLVNADGSDKKLRELDLSAFDHDWTLQAVVDGAGHSRYTQGYCYDLYDRGLGAPPLPAAGASRLYEAGYWPSTYARAVWEAIFQGAGVRWAGELPAVFDRALLPATAPYGYSDLTRSDHELTSGYAPADLRQVFGDEQDAVVPFTHVLPYRRPQRQYTAFPLPRYEDAVDYTDLRQGPAAVFDPLSHTATITLPGYYDLRAEQDVHIYCQDIPGTGEVAATVQVFVNGQFVGNEDQVRGRGNQDASLTALAERVLLVPGDVVQARYKFDQFNGPLSPSWTRLAVGRLRVELLSDFPARGRVKLADWLPDLTQKDFVKTVVQLYGLTQSTDPYTGAVTFRRTAAVLDGLPARAVDWSERRDGSQPAKRSWKLGDLARRNWFRYKDDESNVAYAQAVYEQAHGGLGWDGDAAKDRARAFAAGYLDNGPADSSLDASKDVLTLAVGATVVGAEGLLLLPRWKPKAGTNYADDLQVIADAEANGTYTPAEAEAARAKALADDFDTQQLAPRLVYQLPGVTRDVLLRDDAGQQQLVSMRLSYFVLASQAEDLNWSRSLLPRYYPHLAAALVRPLVLRPYVHLTAAEVVAFDQLVPVWIGGEESAFFWVNKVDQWGSDAPSTLVELIRLL